MTSPGFASFHAISILRRLFCTPMVKTAGGTVTSLPLIAARFLLSLFQVADHKRDPGTGAHACLGQNVTGECSLHP